MAIPWKTLDTHSTPDGVLELRRRAAGDFLICIGGRVLMNSRASRSEEVLAARACQHVAACAAPNILIGGLGMGLTARAALDALPGTARVTVAELNPIVLDWCRGPLAEVHGDCIADPRLSVVVRDVAEVIREVADEAARPRFDAIVLDLYEGPHAKTDPKRDPFYGESALWSTHRALAPGGMFAIWSEAPDAHFEARLRRAGFAVECLRPGRGGFRHAVVLSIRR